jgi:hypothetical protein
MDPLADLPAEGLVQLLLTVLSRALGADRQELK